MDAKEYTKLSSLVTSLQMRYAKTMDMKSARANAADEIGIEFEPPITGQELESRLASARRELYPPTVKEYDLSEGASDSSAIQIYRAWCEENEHVTKDAELGFFTGRTPRSFGAARSLLARTEGFIFEKDGNGWIVTAPIDEEKKYTEHDVRNMIEEVIKKMGK